MLNQQLLQHIDYHKNEFRVVSYFKNSEALTVEVNEANP